LTELKPYRVFTPYHRAWLKANRPALDAAPRKIEMPRVKRGSVPALGDGPIDPAAAPGETAARKAMSAWLRRGLSDYARTRDDVERGGSRLSPYLHFGCISARELD